MDLSPFDVALFATMVRLAMPLLLTAMGELISETAGIINIGLEGMMLFGAYTGFIVTYESGSPELGVLAGLAAGVVAAAVMAIVSINLRGDQIVVGVGINLLASGLTLYLYRLQFGGTQPTSPRLASWPVPVLSDLPGIGPVVFDQSWLVYTGYVVVPAIAYVLGRTSWGLLLRSVGDVPEATEAAGVSVFRLRWTCLLVTGALAGLGGVMLSVGQVGLFAEEMTAGRGFLALAAVVFGRWNPWGVAAAAFVFGFADALQLRLQSFATVPWTGWLVIVLALVSIGVVWLVRSLRRREPAQITPLLVVATAAVAASIAAVVVPAVNLPSQLWLALPYVLSLVALASFSVRSRVPAALGEPYRAS